MTDNLPPSGTLQGETMKFEFKCRFTAKIIHTQEIPDNTQEHLRCRVALELAVKEKISLQGADLQGTYLQRADLQGAYMQSADLPSTYMQGTKLIGERPVLQIGGIGSRNAYLISYMTDEGIKIKAGCFSGSLAEFAAAVKKEHGNSNHGKEYAAAITMIKAHAKIWKPKKEKVKS